MSFPNHHQIMAALDPNSPETIDRLIALHHEMFGEATMEADGAADGQGQDEAGKAGEAGGKDGANQAGKTGDDGEPLGAGGIKALQAERDARAKAEQERDALQKQIDDAKLSAEEKAAKDLQSAKDEGTEAKNLLEKYRVARDKGLDLNLAERLQGATRAELEADADNLKGILGAAAAGPKADDSAGKGGGTDKATATVAGGRDLYKDRHPSK